MCLRADRLTKNRSLPPIFQKPGVIHQLPPLFPKLRTPLSMIMNDKLSSTLANLGSKQILNPDFLEGIVCNRLLNLSTFQWVFRLQMKCINVSDMWKKTNTCPYIIGMGRHVAVNLCRASPSPKHGIRSAPTIMIFIVVYLAHITVRKEPLGCLVF
ncbi:hypothetical protein DVH24_035222 [Malus domestica]|uniref:Uncharacterized protein n=1 Tax=Malus domestica TaxID=3750 RepID=A0A498J4C0_MALDO|nr:hypothetical protein DVH24_035222 [Malus domestica]